MANLTDEEIHSASEIIVSRMRLNDPVDFGRDFIYWLQEDQTNRKHKRFQIIIDDKTDISYGLVHGFLLENGFIGRVSVGVEVKFLTEKGAEFKRAKSYSNYLKSERNKRIQHYGKGIVAYAVVPIAILITLYFTWCLWQLENSHKNNNDISYPTQTGK